MGRVWGAIVEENTIQVHISAIRKALGPDRGMLKTISGRGYRLLGSWTIREEEHASAEPIYLEQVRKSVRPFRSNLPSRTSDLIGRDGAVQQLRNLLSAYRAVTLTGPGGIGKTSLALEVARNLFPTFQGDVWLVELVSLSDPGLVPSAVAGVLGLKLAAKEISPQAVARAIGGKKLLLVLDNVRARPFSPPAENRCVLRASIFVAFLRWTCRRRLQPNQTMSLDIVPFNFLSPG
jgi:non-specific serine/threonine protein kinase